MKTKTLFAGIQFLCVATSLTALNALANDTSFANIEVDSINTNAKVGTFITFQGEEARALMQVLPAISSVLGPIHDSHFKELAVLSPGYMLNISCQDHSLGNGKPVPVTPSCRIGFDKKLIESDTFKFQPETQCH